MATTMRLLPWRDQSAGTVGISCPALVKLGSFQPRRIDDGKCGLTRLAGAFDRDQV